MCFWPAGSGEAQESVSNQFWDCEVEKNIMASDPRALSKEGLSLARYSWMDTHAWMCIQTVIGTDPFTYTYSRKVHLAHFTAIHHSHTLMHSWRTHTQLKIKCTHDPDTYMLHASLLMKHTHLCTHACCDSFCYLRALSCTHTRKKHLHVWALAHTLFHSHVHTLPLEHWMQHTRTHCQIDLVPWNAG